MCKEPSRTIGVQIEFDETGQQIQLREHMVKILATFQVMVTGLQMVLGQYRLECIPDSRNMKYLRYHAQPTSLRGMARKG